MYLPNWRAVHDTSRPPKSLHRSNNIASRSVLVLLGPNAASTLEGARSCSASAISSVTRTGMLSKWHLDARDDEAVDGVELPGLSYEHNLGTQLFEASVGVEIASQG